MSILFMPIRNEKYGLKMAFRKVFKPRVFFYCKISSGLNGKSNYLLVEHSPQNHAFPLCLFFHVLQIFNKSSKAPFSLFLKIADFVKIQLIFTNLSITTN